VRSFTDTDTTVLGENTTPINQNEKSQNKGMQSRLIRLIGVVFSNGAMLSVSDKYDSVNECTTSYLHMSRLPSDHLTSEILTWQFLSTIMCLVGR